MNENEDDEQFYRDTEAIAFPKLDDRQIAMLEPLGERRALRRGEILFKAGQRDLGMTVILSGGLEAFEARDSGELILANPGPRDFVGEIAMLTGNATLVNVRGKAELSEVLVVGATELRRALSELPGLGEIIVSALIMRRKRLQRDREFS
ncbi:MAG TPA: cyclic nucleotide-binding domain-containing protein, partial [Chthoniobacterales bacterium]|nr:cyclic nucleotide-binding domain-containing protein [Chthoniobacterales bacterium]